MPPLPIERHLTTPGDILRAVRWRIARIDGETLAMLSQEVRAWMDARQIADIRAGSPDTVAMLLRIATAGANDRRDPWGLLCAFVALWAQEGGDTGMFYAAGLEVIAVQRQSRTGERRRNELTELMLQYLANQPEANAAEVFEHFIDMAGLGAIPFDGFARGKLKYRPGPTAPVREIGFDSFARHFRRLFPKQSGHLPANVRKAA